MTSLPVDYTVFEKLWNRPDGSHLFKSKRHQVMAVADAFPKFRLQAVVAPAASRGDGKPEHFFDLDTTTRLKMHLVADAVGKKIFEHCAPLERVIAHTEGFGVPNHAHIVLFAAERNEGQRLYDKGGLGPLAVENTFEALQFTEQESEILEATLDDIITVNESRS